MENLENDENIEKTNVNIEEIEETSIIKHIVIAGGGATGLSYYGILKEASKRGVWNIENIQSIYGTSVGSIVATVLSLKYDWETIDDYFIKRPWNTVFKFNIYSILECYTRRGIFDVKVIEEMFLPLFKGKDISMDVTMKEFYELTNVELHFFSTELTKFELIDFSYKTHPDWKIVDVIYCSSCLPVLFSPFLKDGKSYCDGGILSNYSIDECIKNGIDPSEILGVYKKNKKINSKIDHETTLFDYMIFILTNYLKKYSMENFTVIPKEYVIETEPTTIVGIYNFSNSIEERIRLIEDGVNLVTGYFSNDEDNTVA